MHGGAGALHAPPPASPPKVDGSIECALRQAVPLGRGVVLLTFGDSGVHSMLSNFVEHAVMASAPFMVGAVDMAAFELLAARRVAVYKTPLALRSGYTLDGSNAHASDSWQSFAKMRSGEVARVVALGYDVLHTDVDVVWLRNPAPYVACTPSATNSDPPAISCSTLLAADVAVSSDSMSPQVDTNGGIGAAVGGVFNTGILLVRATPAGKAFAAEWHATVVARACPPNRPGDCHEGRCCTSDQQVFNRMVRSEKLGYPGIRVPRGPARTVPAAGVNVTLGSLPLALFLHGHGYFVQRRALERPAQAEPLPRPYAVHATYSLDHHDHIAKAQRFREAGLWHADAPTFSEGRYLALVGTTAPEVSRSRQAHGAANIATHMAALGAYALELRDALALALALNRTLILPRWTCYCDRLWSGSDDIFHFGCMYPGSQDARFVPFTCPMDHVLSPKAWHDAGVAYRDPIFLDRFPTVVDVAVEGADDDAAYALGVGPRLPSGLSDVEAAKRLRPYDDAPVLRIARGRGLLCGIANGDTLRRFNRLAAQVLKTPSWCSTCFSPCKDELSKWLDAPTIAKGADGPNRWCAHFAPPAAMVTC